MRPSDFSLQGTRYISGAMNAILPDAFALYVRRRIFIDT